MSKFKAVGVHVFAGGFTMGVKRVMDVECQLETFDLGRETVKSFGVPFVQHKDASWPHVECSACFGNPRCTGFSTLTAGCGDSTHGSWSKQTLDVHQLCQYAAGRYDVVVWESVQQAYSVGRALLDYIRDEYFKPKGYRIAHLFINAATFGNAQQRKRYFFVAYRDDRNFNITPPEVDPFYGVLYDAIYRYRNEETWPVRLSACRNSGDYDANCYVDMTEDEWTVVPHLPNGWDMNFLAKYHTDVLTPNQRRAWDFRQSPTPFSRSFCVYRTNWLRPCPTLHSGSMRLIHPDHDRPLTIGELATVMGWGDVIPIGPHPVGQIVKGVVPDVGEWLAHQVVAYLQNDWGSEDWESSYDPARGEWVGRDTHGQLEKVFDLTKYCGRAFDQRRYDLDVVQRHRFNVHPVTGKLIRSWDRVAVEERIDEGDHRVLRAAARPRS